MAKNNNFFENNEPTAGDDRNVKFVWDTTEPQDDEFVLEDANSSEKEFDSIDVTDEGGFVQSDSDLDINELLRKYMPEYESEPEEIPSRGGVLSAIRESAETDDSASDDELIDALDSAFAAPAEIEDEFVDDGFVYADDTEPEYDAEDEYVEANPAREKKKSFFSRLFSRKKKEVANEVEYDSEYSEYGLDEADEYYTDDAVDYAEDVLADYDEELFTDAPAEFYDEAPAEVYEEAPAEEYVDTPAEIYEEAPAEVYEEAPAEIYEEAPAEIYEEAPAEEYAYMPMEDTAPAEVYEDTAEPAPEYVAEDESFAELFGNEVELEPTVAEETIVEETADEGVPIDPTDINLMIAFGLDSEDGEHSTRAKALGDRLEERQIKRESRANKLDHAEFVDKSQIPAFRKEFAQKSRSLWIKLVLCIVFTAILLVFENITSLTKLFTGNEQQFAGVFDPAVYPVVYIMASLQLMLLACVCAFDQIVDGFKYLFRGIPRPESMTAILAVAGIVYSAVLSIIVKTPNEPVMFNFVVALSALLTLVYAIINNKREFMNFKIIANKKPKHIMRRLLDEESEGEARAFADTEDICDVMKIEKTDFIDGFYGRLSRSNQNTNTFMTFLMGISVAAAVLFGIFVNFRGGDGMTVASVIFSSMLIIAPLSIFVTFSYPFYRANVAAREYDSAIIGECSLDEYSNASIISFDDKNVFPSYSVKVQNIRIYNNARIDRVLYYAASVFAYAGGPLQDVFEVATKDMGNSDNVQIFDTEAGFLATQVDGVNIIFGNYNALVGRGLEIPESAAEDDVDLSDELEIMYMFRESKLVAKMYIKYVMDADIDLILKQFANSGLYVCVRTFDPNIDERMIAKKLNMRRMPLKIVRYASADEVGVYEAKVDSGLVTCGSPKSLLQIVSYCGKVLHTKKTNVALSVLSVMISIAILLLLTIANSLTSMSSLFIAVYQLIWLIPMFISSRVFIR